MSASERTACRATVTPTVAVSTQAFTFSAALNPGDVAVIAISSGGNNAGVTVTDTMGGTWAFVRKTTQSPTLTIAIGFGFTSSGATVTIGGIGSTTMSAVGTAWTGLTNSVSVVGASSTNAAASGTSLANTALASTAGRVGIAAASHSGGTSLTPDINAPTWSSGDTNTRVGSASGGNNTGGNFKNSALDYIVPAASASIAATYSSTDSGTWNLAQVELIPDPAVHLTGTAHGVGTGSGAVGVARALSGTAHGVATASGGIGGVSLAGASHGVATASGSITVSLFLTATGTRTRGGSVTLGFNSDITPPAGTPGQGWEVNGHIRAGWAILDLNPVVTAPPATTVPVKIETLSTAYLAPTIIDGQPTNADGSPWSPTDGEGTHGCWGTYRVIIGGIDHTWIRGAQTLVIDHSDEDPGGDATLTLVFPSITSYDQLNTGDLDNIRPSAAVRVEHRDCTGAFADDVFDGELEVETDTVTDAGSGGPASYLSFTARGWWGVLDDFITLPRVSPDPIEAAEFIEGLAARAQAYGWPASMPKSGVEGMLIPERGEYGSPTMSQSMTNALKLMTADDGTVYTVKHIGRNRLQIAVREWGGAPDFHVWVGARGISHTLTRDATQAWTAIYGRGQHLNQAWENWQYPTAYINPPAYPLPPGPTCGVNLFCAGSGATGFQVFSDELRNFYDLDLASQDTYLAGDFQTIFDYQGSIGVQQDGVVGPQTWNQTFQLGQNADALADAYIRELWSSVSAQPYLLNARGGIVGPNPDWHPNAFPRRETLIDFGVLDKTTARKSARREGLAGRIPFYVGTVTARNVDPVEMSALDTRAGMNMRLKAHRGTDRDLHVIKREVQTGMTVGGGQADRVVTWTVAEKPVDFMTLAQILARKQGVRDLVHNNRPQRRSAHRTPDWVPFDSESGAGIQQRVAQFAGLWNVLWVPMGEAVDVVAVELHADRPTLISACVFNSKVTPANLVALPGLANPSAGSTDPYQANTNALQALGIQWASGQTSAMQGYWPNAPGGTVTGVLADTSPWPFRTLKPPYGYLAVWTSVDCHISGDPTRGFRAIFPAPEK